MAGERIYAARYAKHPTNAIAGVTHCRITPSAQRKRDAGVAGTTGLADSLVSYRGVGVELYGSRYAALLGRIGQAKADLVLGTYGQAGALQKITIKNVIFLEAIGSIEIPRNDAGGKLATCGIRGIALWGANDTFATMIDAADD